MINKGQASLLRQLLLHDGFQVLLDMAEKTIDKWDNENVIGNTDFETLKLTFSKEYKKQGLRDFLDLVEREASA
jgi:hypothetical protein